MVERKKIPVGGSITEARTYRAAHAGSAALCLIETLRYINVATQQLVIAEWKLKGSDEVYSLRRDLDDIRKRVDRLQMKVMKASEASKEGK
jgi:hypothetical protein